MRVNFKKKFKNFKGEDVDQYICDVVAESLFNAGVSEQLKVDDADKFKAYAISQKLIVGDGVVDITTEEATLIKDLCMHCLTAGAYGQLYEIIEQLNSDKDETY